MKRILLIALPLFPAALMYFHTTRSAPAEQPGQRAAQAVSFRVVFGWKQEKALDYSGSISLSEGKVLTVKPWRFFGDDSVKGSSWKLALRKTAFENQPDKPAPGGVQNFVPAGVVVTVEAPSSAVARIRTAQGDVEAPLRDMQYGRILTFRNGDVTVERAPLVEQVSTGSGENDYPSLTVTRQGAVWTAWQAFEDGGDTVYARHSTPNGWSQNFRLTEQKTDVYRTAVAEDGRGRIWVVWSERAGQDWDLYSRTYDGKSWSARRKITSLDRPNMSHRLGVDSAGTLHLVWIGYRGGQSHVFWSKLSGDTWSTAKNISGPGAWVPEMGFDSKGSLYIAWDSYRNGNYDIFLRKISSDGAAGGIIQVTKSPAFQAHPSITVDKRDRVWLAWDESDVNWGKDYFNHDTVTRGAVLYSRRKPRVAVLEGGVWKQPKADILEPVPGRYSRYIQFPRITCDGKGRIWLSLQVRTASGTNRDDNWSNNGSWERFLTSIEGDRWTPLMPIPDSSSRPEGTFEIQPTATGPWMIWATDNRPGFGSRKADASYEVDTARFENRAESAIPSLVAFNEEMPAATPVHANEPADVARMRTYRASAGGATYRIVRGDFHRHTEISQDGAGDGSVEDYFRYMLDAAAMDTGIIADHSAGGTDYTWWRTEKAIDLFLIRDRFTALFGYERSVKFPNGHRNVVFANRGVPVLKIPLAENRGTQNTGPLLYPYLKQYRGICFGHSLTTNQGTDFRDNDPEVEPLVEIYQGYRTSYEYEGAPRSTGGEKAHPEGYYRSALAKGYKLGVQSSSDHVSTHSSYTLVYTPDANRTSIVESMRQRRAYGATDNILVDYRATDDRGRVHFMGEAFDSTAAPKLSVKIAGTTRLSKVEVVKDGKFVFLSQPEGQNTEFTYVDNNPQKGTSYYYVRVIQADGNLAWSSPMWVNYR
jgi:hypothetical protein